MLEGLRTGSQATTLPKYAFRLGMDPTIDWAVRRDGVNAAGKVFTVSDVVRTWLSAY